MKKQNSYNFFVELNGDGSGDASGYTDYVFEDSYVYSITATGASIPVAGTLVVATEAVTGAAAKTILSDAVKNAGININPYKLVQDADGADISGEYNQTFVRRGERLKATGSVLGAAGTLYVNITMSNVPLPVTR
jgi:hypothetical protein